jgi:hypothetical protein
MVMHLNGIGFGVMVVLHSSKVPSHGYLLENIPI